jgi:hypothetical protein
MSRTDYNPLFFVGHVSTPSTKALLTSQLLEDSLAEPEAEVAVGAAEG